MDPQEIDLLIEVHVTAGKRSAHLTGYPIAPDRIVTARHGLLLDEAGSERTIEVRWPAPAAQARDWRPATLEKDFPDFDVAVLSCPFPATLPRPLPLLREQPLQAGLRWSGDGFAAAADRERPPDDPGPPLTGRHPFGGTLYPGGTGEARCQVGVDHPCDDSRYYAGASGMPVIVEHRIAGVVIERDLKAKTLLHAISIPALLADEDFKKAIGYDQGLARRADAVRTIAGQLAGSRLKGICERLHEQLVEQGVDCPSAAPATVAEALLRIDLRLVWEAFYAALQQAGTAGPLWRHGIAEIVGELLPVSYDPGAVTGIDRCQDEADAWCIELPAGCTTAGEIIMAGLRARPARFRPIAAPHALPQPRDLLPAPPDGGFDGDGAGFAADVETDLANLLAAGNHAAVEAWLGRRFRPGQEAQVRNDTDREALRRMVARELREQAKRERRFYYVLLKPIGDATRGQARPAVQTLKGHYPELDFAVLVHDGVPEVVDREEEQLLTLRYLLPGTQDFPR